MDIKELYAEKGRLITQIEIAQRGLQIVNRHIEQMLKALEGSEGEAQDGHQDN